MNDVGLEIARHHRQEDRPCERARYEKRASGHDLGRSLADCAAAEARDDSRRKRQEDKRLNHWGDQPFIMRSEEHTSELQSLMRISYAVFCLKKQNTASK